MGLLDYLPGLYADPYANNPNLPSGPIIDGAPANPWLIDSLIGQRPGLLNNPTAAALAPAAAPSAPPAAPAAALPTAPQSVTYPSPLQTPDPAAIAAAYGSMGIDPGSLPQRSPFDVPQAPAPLPQSPSPAPSPFDAVPKASLGGGAPVVSPFSFAGPGSNRVMPESISAPPPAPTAFGAGATPVPYAGVPAVNQPPAGPAVNVASAAPAAPAAAAAADDDDEDATPANATPRSGVLPAAPAAAAPAPFSLGGAGLGDRLSAAFQGSQGARGLIPKLFNFGSGLATGQRADLNTPAITANMRWLASMGASPEAQQAAAVNPTLMQAFINQYAGKDKFAHVEVEDPATGVKTARLYNENTGEWAGGAPPGVGSVVGGNTVIGPNGKPIPIPAGLVGSARKEFLNRVAQANADAATGKLTDEQAKSSSYAARMDLAEAQLGKLQNQGLNFTDKAYDNLPFGVGNYLQSPQYQQYKQAQSAFISAKLRRESGAAINKSEFDREEKELFPQPGDSPAVVQQKAQTRAAATAEMRRAAGPGYRSPGASGTTASGIKWSVQ